MRLLKTDSDGNLYFAVAGYVPRGQYEGKVAIVLYKYAAQEKQIQELVYLPIDTTEQQLNKDFNNYGYVSGKMCIILLWPTRYMLIIWNRTA